MQMRLAVKLIVTLIIILLILLVSLLIVTKKLDDKADETSADIIDTEQTEETTGLVGGDTTGEDTVDIGTTVPDTNIDTAPADTTTSLPDTEPPGDIAPSDFAFIKTLKSDTGTRLNIVVEMRGEATEDGRVKLVSVMYLEYYSIGISSRNGCRLTVGDASKVFSVEAISEDEEKKHTKYLCQVEKICDYGETVDISARFPFRGVYSGVAIEYLEIDSSVTIK